MDSSQMLPVSTIVSMWIGLVITLVLPLTAVVFLGVKKRGSAVASIVGVLSYGVSFCVYGLLWCVYVALFSDGYDTVGLTWDFYLVLALLNGVVATLFNFLFLKKMCKKQDKPETALSFFAGYALVICYQSAVTQISDLYWAMKYNSMGLEALTESLDSSVAAPVTDQLYNISMYGTMYLVKALETLLYVVCYLALGYLLYTAVKAEKKWHKCALLLVILLQIGIVLPAQLIKSESLDVAGQEILLACVSVLAVICAGIVYMKKNKLGENKL